MDVDYQVLRFDNKIKPKKMGGLGVELEQRKGSGNYDSNRTQFNKEYVGLDGHPTLASKVYQTLYTNNIHFNKGDNTNILNGCIVTSGPEFFKKLNLPMKDTGRTYVEGLHIGESIYAPDLKSKEDIPKKVLEYFDESFNYLSNLVGKENVVYAGIHFDEDTPHMHFYFLPVVKDVKRKVFETDKSGKRITKQIYTKDNNIKTVPIQKKDEKGKPIYEIEHGKFLNSDEFWKQHGGKASFAKIQDEYHDYITSKGFDLDRGKIGSNKHHKDKAEHNIEVLNKEIEKLKQEININKLINESELKTRKELNNIDEDEIFSPSKEFLKRYKEKDIENLIDYSKDIKKDNIESKNELRKKSIKIEKLENEIKQFKSGKTYRDKDKVIANQQNIINEQKGIIESLNNEIQSLKDSIKEIMDTIGKKLNEAYLALAHLFGFRNVTEKNLDKDLIEDKVRDINIINKYKNRPEKSTRDYDDYSSKNKDDGFEL